MEKFVEKSTTKFANNYLTMGIILIVLSLPVLGLGIMSFTFTSGTSDLPISLGITLFGMVILVFGLYRVIKSIKIKKNPYVKLQILGTSRDAETVASDFNKEYDSKEDCHEILETKRAFELYTTKNYIFIKTPYDIALIPKSSVLWMYYNSSVLKNTYAAGKNVIIEKSNVWRFDTFIAGKEKPFCFGFIGKSNQQKVFEIFKNESFGVGHQQNEADEKLF